MVTAKDMAERWKRLSVEQLAERAAAGHEVDLANLNREQLLEGKNSDGGFMGPRISQDPFFEGNMRAAMNYANWKRKLFPQTPYDTPNLIINGYTHSHIKAMISGGKLTIKFDNLAWGNSIESKYQGKELGLNEDSRSAAWRNFMRAKFVKELAAETGCGTT